MFLICSLSSNWGLKPTSAFEDPEDLKTHNSVDNGVYVSQGFLKSLNLPWCKQLAPPQSEVLPPTPGYKLRSMLEIKGVHLAHRSQSQPWERIIRSGLVKPFTTYEKIKFYFPETSFQQLCF